MTNWRERMAQILPILTIVIYVVVSTIGAFSGGLWGGAGIGLGILLFLGTAFINRSWPRPSRDFLILALVALGVMALLNLGSIKAEASWFDWKRLVTIFLPLLMLTSPEIIQRAYHPKLFPIMIASAAAGLFALGVELFLNAPILHSIKGDKVLLNQYNRGLSYVVIVALPMLAALGTRHMPQKGNSLRQRVQKILPCVVFIALLLFPTSLTESRSAKLALMLALLTVFATHLAPKVMRWALSTLIFLLLGWPLVVQKCFILFQDKLSHLPDSWRARVEIWDYMSYRIMEHPWLGWGLGTSKFLDFQNPHGSQYIWTLVAAPHPHNVVTQLWVELGIPGLVLGVAFALLSLRQASKLSPPLIPFAYGAWMAALCFSLIAFNFWTDSLFSAFALTAFAFLILDQRVKARNNQT